MSHEQTPADSPRVSGLSWSSPMVDTLTTCARGPTTTLTVDMVGKAMPHVCTTGVFQLWNYAMRNNHSNGHSAFFFLNPVLMPPDTIYNVAETEQSSRPQTLPRLVALNYHIHFLKPTVRHSQARPNSHSFLPHPDASRRRLSTHLQSSSSYWSLQKPRKCFLRPRSEIS